MLKYILVSIALFPAGTAVAQDIQYPVSIPAECVELAQREGHPLTIASKTQGMKAKFQLARMSSGDPLVRQCRGAVGRLQAQLGK